MKKRIVWGITLIVFIIGVIFLLKEMNTSAKKLEKKANSASRFNKNTDVAISDSEKSEDFERVELEDGILYSKNGKKENADMVIGDIFYDTTINDIYLNPDSYKNKKIEIEGMYLSAEPYTFVGRFSTSNLCPYCPAGYSYIEYEFDGKLEEELDDQQNWLKIVGTVETGNDESSGYTDYQYIKVLTLEIMNEKGNDTVNN